MAVHICVFDRIQGGNYIRGEPIGRAEVEVRVFKIKNEKAAGKDEITGEMIKGGDRVVDLIWKLCNMAIESGVMPEGGRCAVFFHCKMVKEREMNVRIIEVLDC